MGNFSSIADVRTYIVLTMYVHIWGSQICLGKVTYVCVSIFDDDLPRSTSAASFPRQTYRDQDHSTTQESPWLLLLGRYLSKLSGNSAAFWAWLFIPSLSLSVGSTRSCSSLNFYRKRKRFPFFFVKLSDFSTMIQSASFFLLADSYILQWNTTVVVDQPVVKIVWNFVAMSNYIKIMLDCYCGLGLC